METETLTSLLKTHKRKALALLLAALLAGGTLAWWLTREKPLAFYGGGRVKVTFAETVLAPKLPGYIDGSLRFNDDMTVLAFVVDRDGKQLVVRNGVEGKPYDEIVSAGPEYAGRLTVANASTAAISAAGDGHLAYAVRRGDKYLMVVDGVESAEYDELFCGVTRDYDSDPAAGPGWYAARGFRDIHRWALNGAGFAFTARRGDASMVVLGGVEYPAADGVIYGSLAVSGKGDRAVYAAVKDGRCALFVNGVACDVAFNDVRWIYFSPDGAHWYGYFEDSSGPFTVVDGVRTGSDIVAADWGTDRFAYAVKGPGGVSLVTEGRTYGPYDAVKEPSWGPDGSRIVFAARRDGAWRVVDNGAEGAPFSDILSQPWTAAGGGLAYRAALDGKIHAVVNGVIGPAYDVISHGPVITPDGRHCAYAACRDGQWLIVKDGVEQPSDSPVAHVWFSGDGSRFLHALDRSGSGRGVSVFLDGEFWCAADEMPFFWISPDHKHLQAALDVRPSPLAQSITHALNKVTGGAFHGGPRFCVVVDRVRSRCYNESLTSFFTDDSKHFVWFVRNGARPILLVDGLETRYLDPWSKGFIQLEQPHAAPDRHIFLAERDGNFVRVEMTFESLD